MESTSVVPSHSRESDLSADAKPFRMPRNTLVIVADGLALVGCFFLSALLARVSFTGPWEWALLAVTFAVPQTGSVSFKLETLVATPKA